MRHARRLAFAFLYASYLVAFTAVVDYVFFWRPFVANLVRSEPTDLTPPAAVDDATMRQLGALRADRTSSFSRFAPEKPPGRVRLCALGDSFTYGDEVADGHDFPALLQQTFRDSGRTDVDVLNFGNPWYGFHQAFLLWERVGLNFGCDYVLLGPDCFQPERDTTFNHTGLAFPYYLHARYVLAGSGVGLVEVVGETAEERFDAYFGFVPRLRYLRYDRNPPAALQAMLLAGRTIANPFYYDRRDPAEEARATYSVLLRRLAEEAQRVLLLHALGRIVDVANDIGQDGLVAVLAPRMERFPYAAPGGHYSAFGNRWIAEQYHALLVDDAPPPSVLTFEDLSVQPAAAETDRPELSSYERIEVRIGERPVGLLSKATSIPALRTGSTHELRSTSVAALVGIETDGTSAVDAAYVALPRALGATEELRLRVAGTGISEEVTLGRVRLVDSRLNVGITRPIGFAFAGDLLLTEESPIAPALRRAPGAEVTVSVGDTVVLRAVAGDMPLRLAPLHGSLENFRAGASQYTAVSALADTGTVTLAVEASDGSGLEVPFVRWRKVVGETFEAPRRLPPGPLD